MDAYRQVPRAHAGATTHDADVCDSDKSLDPSHRPGPVACARYVPSGLAGTCVG